MRMSSVNLVVIVLEFTTVFTKLILLKLKANTVYLEICVRVDVSFTHSTF